jgi:hypothetical protein
MVLACRPGLIRLPDSVKFALDTAGEAEAGDVAALPAILLVFRDGTCCSVDEQSPVGRALRALADVLALRPGRSAAGVR